MKTISFIQPSRNNLKYLKWSYNSIRKNLGTDMKYVGLMISLMMELGSGCKRLLIKIIM